MQNHKLWEKIILYILSFGLTIQLFFVFVICSVSVGVFQNKHILNSLEKTGYYSGVYDRVVSGAQDILLNRGVDITALEGVFRKKKVEGEVKDQASAMIRGNQMLKIDTEEIETRLEENIRKYLGESKRKSGSNQEKELKSLCQHVGNYYKETVHIPFIKYYLKYRSQYYSIIKTALFLLFGGIVILLSLLRKFIHYIAVSFLSASLMVVMVPAWLLGSGVYTHLGVSPKYFYDFLIYYLRGDLIAFLIVGCMGCVFSISLWTFNIKQAKKL